MRCLHFAVRSEAWNMKLPCITLYILCLPVYRSRLFEHRCDLRLGILRTAVGFQLGRQLDSMFSMLQGQKFPAVMSFAPACATASSTSRIQSVFELTVKLCRINLKSLRSIPSLNTTTCHQHCRVREVSVCVRRSACIRRQSARLSSPLDRCIHVATVAHTCLAAAGNA